MPIIDVIGIGPVELPDGMTNDQMKAALDKLPKPAFKPTAENRGNVINSDVPTLVGERPNAVNAQPVQKPSTLASKLRAAVEIPAGIVAPMITEPLSQAYGVARSIPEALATNQAPAPLGQKYAKQASEAMRFNPQTPEAQNVLSAIGETLDAAKLPAYAPIAGNLPAFAAMANPAGRQMAGALRNEGSMIRDAVMPTINRTIDDVQPMIQKANETIVQPMANRAANALRTEPRIDTAAIAKAAPSMDDLSAYSSKMFQVARDSGVELDPKYFSNMMGSVGKDLRKEGYDARLMPKVAIALEEMQNVNMPKDFQELTTLRKFIMNAQKSQDSEESRIATILKAQYDDYIGNMPDSSVIGGNKAGLTAWKEGRDTYARMMKSEIFEDMLAAAELDKTKFSMSGAENSLAGQLRNLAKNDKKMRMFTPDEQKAIIEASKGTNTQNLLRFFGKFAPTSAVSSIPALLTTSVSGPVGLGLAAGAFGARAGATKMRNRSVQNLAAMMRATKKNQAKGLENE